MNEITEKDAGDVPLRIPKTELNLNQLSFFYPKTVGFTSLPMTNFENICKVITIVIEIF